MGFFTDTEAGQQILKAAPAGAGAAYSWFTLNQAVAILTGIYIVIQAAYLLRKWYREEKDWKPRRKGPKL